MGRKWSKTEAPIIAKLLCRLPQLQVVGEGGVLLPSVDAEAHLTLEDLHEGSLLCQCRAL